MAGKDPKVSFKLTFPENLKRDANFSVSDKLSINNIGDFVEEREKAQRIVEDNLRTKLKVDYSDFKNHVFFDSALSKFNIAKDKVLKTYPFNDTLEEKDAFFLTASRI